MFTTSSQLFEYFSRLFTPEVQYLCKNVLILFNKKEVRSIESEKGKERKLSQLLLKYGDLNLVQGIFTAYRKRLFPLFVTKNSSTNQKRAK
jgi:hypothetical protein